MQTTFRFTVLTVILALHLVPWALSAKISYEAIVLVHGGAGDIPDSRDQGKLVGCRLSAKLGYAKLMSSGSVLEAVEEAVRSMELDAFFNAGNGSVLNFDGEVEMDASIMNGSDLKAGCVSSVKDIYHPISLAKHVMLNTNHTYLAGPNVMKFAREQGFEILPTGSLATEFSKDALKDYKKKLAAGEDVSNAPTEVGKKNDEVGTVGAVAIDSEGNFAAATSTGGITGKLPGRVGDSPIIGAGTYADNSVGAVSTTGHGETIMRFSVAQRIIQRMELLKEGAQKATETVLRQMTERIPYTAGAITLDTKGDVGIAFNSNKMAWSYRKGSKIHSGIRHGDDFVENA